MEPAKMDDPSFAVAIASLIIVATDAVPFDPKRRTIYLAHRRVKPATGWWFIGGRLHPGQDERLGMRACFQRETGLDLDPERFRFLRFIRYLWRERKQEPVNAGIDYLAYTYAIELADEEVAAACLEAEEYDRGIGLRPFNRDLLVEQRVHQAILDLYDLIFPPR